MSSVPAASSGSIAGLVLLGCNAKSAEVDSPQNGSTRKAPAENSPTGNVKVNGRKPHGESPSDPLPVQTPRQPLHRVREVREQQGLSIRSAAKRVGVDVKRYKQLEDPYYDLQLSELHAIQKALDVPFSDLLVDRQSLSRPVEERAKMVKVMKTAVAIREAKSTSRVERMGKMLCEQLVELMPELEEVSGWPQFGARRGQSALGKALSQPVDMSQLGLPE